MAFFPSVWRPGNQYDEYPAHGHGDPSAHTSRSDCRNNDSREPKPAPSRSPRLGHAVSSATGACISPYVRSHAVPMHADPGRAPPLRTAHAHGVRATGPRMPCADAQGPRRHQRPRSDGVGPH